MKLLKLLELVDEKEGETVKPDERETMIFQLLCNTKNTEECLNKMSDEKIEEMYQVYVEGK